jgi:hypothetical protein
MLPVVALDNGPSGAAAPYPALYGSGRPAFSPLPSYADAAGASLHQRRGTPHVVGL